MSLVTFPELLLQQVQRDATVEQLTADFDEVLFDGTEEDDGRFIERMFAEFGGFAPTSSALPTESKRIPCPDNDPDCYERRQEGVLMQPRLQGTQFVRPHA